MLSYRHSYHAGSFADVIKHIVIVEILAHLRLKEGAFDYIDTHAGAGLYNLHSAQSIKLQEHTNGIAKLNPADWPELATYFKILAGFNPSGKLNKYPGSPLIAREFLRKRDHAWLYELHPADFDLLTANFARDARVRTSKEDGFTGLLALVPPVSRRGLVLVDPSYEIKTDYSKVVSVVAKAHKQFATGTYAIWYPVIERQRVDKLERQFAATGIRKIQRFELGISADSAGRGMTAAGMLVINPPFTLFATMAGLLPRLRDALALDDGAFFKCDVLAGEDST